MYCLPNVMNKNKKVYVFENGLIVITIKNRIISFNKNLKYFRLIKTFHKPTLRKPTYLWKDGNRPHNNNNYKALNTLFVDVGYNSHTLKIGKHIRENNLLNHLKTLNGCYQVLR